jgi:hypothetical protein
MLNLVTLSIYSCNACNSILTATLHCDHLNNTVNAGILIYEVLAGAHPVLSQDGSELSNMPWTGMGLIDIFTAVTKGIRPTLASGALSDTNVQHAALYASCMQQCLESEPSERPTFAELVARIGC